MLPRDLLACVSVADIVEMMAFDRLEPFSALAAYDQAGTVAATIANVNRGKDSPAYLPEDFMPVLRQTTEPTQARGADLSPEELSNLIDAQIFGVMH